LKSSDSANFTCSVCGAENARQEGPWERDAPTCSACGSSVRLRALAVLLGRELLGTSMPIPDFPSLKSVRGFGLSDPDAWSERMAHKFDYTNSFYHKPPRFDVTSMDERDFGRYDFIVSSEVMEHIEAPV